MNDIHDVFEAAASLAEYYQIDSTSDVFAIGIENDNLLVIYCSKLPLIDEAFYNYCGYLVKYIKTDRPKPA